MCANVKLFQSVFQSAPSLPLVELLLSAKSSSPIFTYSQSHVLHHQSTMLHVFHAPNYCPT